MILITGASGLLGASLVASGEQEGREVVGLSHRHSLNLPGARALSADLTDDSELQTVFDESQPDCVIHCAAATNVDWCEEHPEAARRINVTASATIGRITARTCTPLVYISTDSVFDGDRGEYEETDSPAPMNVYAKSKLDGERAVLARNPLAAVARVNMYGWNAQNKQSLAEWILERLASGNVVHGFTDAIFCPILANDLANILLAMVDHKLSGVYHVVGSEALSKFEFARRLAATFGLDGSQIVPAKLTESKLKAPRPRNTSLCTGKISKDLDRSMPDVDSGLRKFRQLQVQGYVERMRAHLTEAGA